MGTGTWAEFHPQEGALHPWVPIAGDGGWTPSPLPSLWAGSRLVPSTKNHPWGLSLLGAHSSILPAPQTRPSAAQPPGRSPAPSPGQPGKPWEGSCPLSHWPPAPTSPSAPSPWQSPAGCRSPGAGRAGAAACHGWAGTCRWCCHGGSAMVGRWVLAPCPPCPHHPILKVGMHECPWVPHSTAGPFLEPLGMEGSREQSTQWVLGADGACQAGCCGLSSNSSFPLLTQTTG